MDTSTTWMWRMAERCRKCFAATLPSRGIYIDYLSKLASRPRARTGAGDQSRGSRVGISFKNCTISVEERELTRDSTAVPIGPQVFDLLVYLIENRDRVVTKDELLDA